VGVRNSNIVSGWILTILMTTVYYFVIKYQTRVVTHYKESECVCEFVNTFAMPDHFYDLLLV